MKKKIRLISFLLIISLTIGIAADTAAAESYSEYEWPYFSSASVSCSNDNFSIRWTLTSTENITGIDVFGVDRDEKEILLASLSPTATKYELNDGTKVYAYKVYETLEDVENSYFSEYLLSDGITGVNYPTQAQIKKMWKKLSPKNKTSKFSTKPTNKKPYKKGAVAQSTLNNGLNTLNFIRYVAGISSDVKIKKSYQSLAQAAAVCTVLF
jgi:hypothetical protein